MPLNIDFQQILLHMFNLVLLFAILYFLLYKPVKDFMEKRRHEYEQKDQTAHDDMQQAAALKKDYEDKLAAADADIAKERAEAMQKVEDEREKIIAGANEKAAGIVEAARNKAIMETNRIMGEAKNELAGYVTKMAEKIVLDKEDEDGFDTFFAASEDEKND